MPGNLDMSKKGAMHPPRSYVKFDIEIRLYKMSSLESEEVYDHPEYEDQPRGSRFTGQKKYIRK